MGNFVVKNLKIKTKTKEKFLVNFDTSNKKVIGFLYDDKIAYFDFYKKLIGKKKSLHGLISLNDKNNLIFETKKERPITVIHKPIRFPFFPSHLILSLKLMFSTSFWKEALYNYYQNLYTYKINTKALNDKNLTTTFKTIESKIIFFIENNNKLIANQHKVAMQELTTLNQKWLNELPLENETNNFKKIILLLINKWVEIQQDKQKLIMLQALWDQLNELSFNKYYCDCKIKAKKEKRELAVFGYFQVRLIAKKYLKLLNLRIIYQRYSIFKKYFLLQRYLRQTKQNTKDNLLLKEVNCFLKGYKNNRLKYFAQWKHILKQRIEKFEQKTRFLISIQLAKEKTVLQKTVFDITHKYHNVYQNREIVYSDLSTTNEKLKKQRKEIKNIFYQSWIKIEKIFEKTNTRISWVELTTRLSSFNLLKINVIKAYLKQSELIIFDRLINNLNSNEIRELNYLTRRLQSFNWNTQFIYTSNTFANTKDFCDWFYVLGRRNISFSNSENLNKPATLKVFSLLFDDFRQNIFKATYNREKNFIQTEFNRIYLPKKNKFKTLKHQNQVYVAFNPLNINLHKTNKFNPNLNLTINGNVKNVKLQYDLYQIEFETIAGVAIKIISSNREKWKKHNRVYFNFNSFLVYDANQNLIAYE